VVTDERVPGGLDREVVVGRHDGGIVHQRLRAAVNKEEVTGQ